MLDSLSRISNCASMSALLKLVGIAFPFCGIFKSPKSAIAIRGYIILVPCSVRTIPPSMGVFSKSQLSVPYSATVPMFAFLRFISALIRTFILIISLAVITISPPNRICHN